MTADSAIRPVVRALIPRIRLTGAPPGSLTFETGAVQLGARVCWAARLAEFELVEIFNVTRGIAATAHVRYGPEGEAMIARSAAAFMQPGDALHISAYAWVGPADLAGRTSTIVHLDEGNRVIEVREVRARMAILDPASFPQPPSIELISM
ncbi:MAG: aspartate decarboxylase [Verrucomicrobia bacterium]|nr:aspartate decarboxylase [Verrucomicrobiota bacterium]